MQVVIALIVLVIVSVGLGSAYVLYVRLRRALAQRAFNNIPDRLTLKPRLGKWRDSELMTNLASPLIARGFKDLGAHSAPELPGVAMHVLLQPADMALAVIYEHAKAGHWIEIVSYYTDGTSVTYSTNSAATVAARPGHVRFKGVGLNSGALYTKFKNERPNKPLIALDETTAVARLCHAYAEETTWRKERGILPDELSAVLLSKSRSRSRLGA